MHKNFNMMKRYAIPLVKTFGSKALSNVCMILSSASHTRMFLSFVMLAMMMLAPSFVRGAVYNFDWQYWLNAATNAYLYDSGADQNCSGAIIMSGNNYVDIEGAQTVTRVQYRAKNNNTGNYGTSKMEVYERLAFVLNTEGKANQYNGNNGWYLRAEPKSSGSGYDHRALYTGCQGSKLAILSLRGGDKVTITFEGGDHVEGYGAGIHYNQSVHCYQDGHGDAYNETGVYFESGQPIYITSSGDLIVDANIGTYITDIKIETADVAEYEITTSGNSSTFKFTGNGVLDDNDFALPYLSFSMGSFDDYLAVSNLEAHMVRPNGSEDLVTDPKNYFQPSAGSFYSFKPTASGTITINEGSIQGNQIHVFVYNPAKNGVDYNWEMDNGHFYKYTFTSLTNFSFPVEKGKTYYICQDNQNESGNALHLKKFTFTTTFYVKDLGVVIENVDNLQGDNIAITQVDPAGGYELKVKRCSANINPAMSAFIQNGWLYMSKPSFTEGTDHAGTVIWDLVSDGGEAAIVVTFPYSAAFNDVDNPDPNRTYGHTWNFIDPRNSDSNIGNCLIRSGIASFNPGTTSGILSIGQDKDHSSQFYLETEQREWIYAQRQTGSSGGFHDPMYKNVFDMVGDNADMIWETEGLIFETSPNLSCLYNENDAVADTTLTNPLNFASPGATDPDRYVGLMPPVQDTDFSSFTIPGLKDGDRVLIFMKSGEGSGTNGIFLNITGAKDALGKQINSAYKAGGTNWQHSRYEGCYHFIKDGDGDMKFTLTGGSMAKLLYIRIYQGQRINTNSIVSTGNKQDENGDDVYEIDEETGEPKLVQDAGRILFMNDKGATKGQYSNMSLRFRGKGQNQKAEVLTSSGNLNYTLANNNAATDSHFTIGGKYNQAVGYTSQVGEIGVFRMREMDMEYVMDYVADFCDRNFTVGYRDKVDSYPYTWDFTDIQGFSSSEMTAEADNYPIAAAVQDEYGNQWDISLFDASGNMKLNTGFDPIENNEIFAPHKIGNGNQLWAGGDVIPEARGLWFYSEDDDESSYSLDYSSSLYNDCLQITSDGIRFANTPDAAGRRVAWWNYKMVVPDVPADGAVYMRMKRDTSVPDDAVTYSERDNADVPFLAARFKFASQGSKTDMVTGGEILNGESYSFFQVPGTTDEWIVAVKNTTGAINHLTFTLNGWIVKKVAVSTDPKSVNIKGYASESRDHAIDASLTSYLIGKEMKSYLVSDPDYKNHKITLTDVGGTNATYVIPANTGYVIKNEEETELKIINDGFHLFVPDMHDKTGKFADVETNNEFMIPVLEQRTGDNKLMSFNEDGTKTNYVLSYKWYDLKPDGSTTGTQHVGDEMFYRVSREGINLRANSAYLVLDTEALGLKTSQGSIQGSAQSAKFTFVFSDWNDTPSVPTAIEEASSVETFDPSNGEWYNMNGQKLNGIPATKGLYIMNGKKVLVK